MRRLDGYGTGGCGAVGRNAAAYVGMLGDDDFRGKCSIVSCGKESTRLSGLRSPMPDRRIRRSSSMEPAKRAPVFAARKCGRTRCGPADGRFDPSAKTLLVDHRGMEGTLRAAKIARKSGMKVVADFE